MKQCLKVKQIKKEFNRITYFYEADGLWKNLLNLDDCMFIEYNQKIDNVPDSLAIVPLLCNILPICWVFDLDIYVDVLDRHFFDSIEKIKKGYSDMYPSIEMLGNIEVGKLEENKYEYEKVGTLFSGGVDAFNTLIQHINEKPVLLTVWGADIKLDDFDGWDTVNKLNLKTANQFDLEYLTIKSNFRTFINYNALSSYISKYINGEWWHEFQHGIGLIGLTAPLAYINKFSIVYIASSYTAKDKGKYTCASDPTIDNYLKFSNCNVIHDGYNFDRQDKIHNICKYVGENNKKIMLRVCWESTGGKNCCQCEKCYRTILGILTEKKKPADFGFDLDDKKRKIMMKKLPQYVKYNLNQQYSGMQNHFLKNYSFSDIPKDLIWFKNIKIENKKPFYIIAYDKFKRITKRIIKKIKNLIKF